MPPTIPCKPISWECGMLSGYASCLTPALSAAFHPSRAVAIYIPYYVCSAHTDAIWRPGSRTQWTMRFIGDALVLLMSIASLLTLLVESLNRKCSYDPSLDVLLAGQDNTACRPLQTILISSWRIVSSSPLFPQNGVSLSGILQDSRP